MTSFPAIEAYRAELRRLDDAGLAEAQRRHAEAHRSSAIEDVHPTDEQAAFWAMLFEERAPQDVRHRFADRFLQERIVGPALARQAAAAESAHA